MARGLLAAFAALIGIGCSQPDPEAHRMVDEGAVLLDVRTPGEYSGGHLRGSTNIPVQNLEAHLDEFSADTPVVVYCRSGARSAAAAGMLRTRGVEVYDLGAMNSWGNPDDIVR